MEVQDLMAAMATRLATIPGIAGASYPPPSSLPASPWIMVRLSDEPTQVQMTSFGKQTVLPQIDALLLIAALLTLRIQSDHKPAAGELNFSSGH